jgi:hypothetical protein
MPADRSDAACTLAGVREPSMKESAGNGRRWRGERRALWRFADHGAGCGQATPMSVLAGDVAAHDWSVAGAGICGKPGRSMATLTSQRQICTSAGVTDRGSASNEASFNLAGTSARSRRRFILSRCIHTQN